MDSQYKVEFLSTRDIKGAFKINMPTEETDLKYRLSALLEERASQGYKLFKMENLTRINPLTAEDMSGLLLVFEKIG
jgi:hypothetical protein